MLNRRHIRIKVMQSIFAMQQNNNDDLIKQEKFLFYALENILELYLNLLSLLIELQKNEAILIEKKAAKHLATFEEKNPNKKFINNQLLLFFKESKSLQNQFAENKIDTWTKNNDLILILLAEIKDSVFYTRYMKTEETNFKEDQLFINAIFTDVIAPNTNLYDYIEDTKLSWVDDLPTVNTLIIKQIDTIDLKKEKSFKIPEIYKDSDDKEFASLLFRKTVLNETQFEQYYEGKTPNWDINRIARIDIIILKMAICEMLKFPSIPAKVTINEYVEIAKEYSTPNSSSFINGILDVIAKEFETKNMLNKTGRGLLSN